MSRYVRTGSSAAGGIGSVVFCRDQNLDRIVAVKFVQEGAEHRRLLDELAALQRIRSKHVVEIFDVDYFDPGARMGIIEEFVDGSDLERHLGTVAPDACFVRLLYQIAAGIADIHSVGVVHRDIKPSNIRVDNEGIVKIIDFNLSRPTTDAHTHGFVGTRGYAAPELYVNGEVCFDATVDVYALGVTAYALLHGSPLPHDLLARPPRLDAWKAAGGGFMSLVSPVDQDLACLLDACLEEDPTLRPAAAQIRGRAERVLLRGQHQALFVDEGGNAFTLNRDNPSITFEHPSLGKVRIGYDGLDFRVSGVSGELWVNNMPLKPGALLPGCCVIAFGDPSRRASERMFVTMDVSHPEVVL